MNRLTKTKRVQVISALVEGNSIRSTVRMTGVAKNTVTKLLCNAGRVCEDYQDRVMVDLPCKRVQVDEIWSFCYAKERNVPDEFRGQFGYGDIWTWVALDADTKLVPTWLVGNRGAETARAMMDDLAHRLKNRVQLTTDGYNAYRKAVRKSFGQDVDYAQLMKIYGPLDEHAKFQRDSSIGVVGCSQAVMWGKPDIKHISTSFVERQNLTMRMSMRRFTRLTNGFSKKVDNLSCAIALHFMHYNFCRKHKSLGVSPAMAAGISDYLWEIEDIVELIEENESK